MTRSLIGSSRSSFTRVRGNILPNGDFESHPAVITAPTNTATRWVDGTAAGSVGNTGLGWGIISFGAASQAGWDSTVQHSGTYSMKLSATNTSGSIVLGTYRASALGRDLFALSPNTAYTLTGWIKTNNAAASAAFIDFREYSSALGVLVTTSSTKLSGTNNWTQITISVTTNASTVWGTIFLRNGVAGNISDVWFDDITIVKNTIGRSAAGARSAA